MGLLGTSLNKPGKHLDDLVTRKEPLCVLHHTPNYSFSPACLFLRAKKTVWWPRQWLQMGEELVGAEVGEELSTCTGFTVLQVFSHIIPSQKAWAVSTICIPILQVKQRSLRNTKWCFLRSLGRQEVELRLKFLSLTAAPECPLPRCHYTQESIR